MLNLDNALNENCGILTGRFSWDLLGGEEFQYVAELKLDGLSLAVHYRDGKFAQAVTRGDGATGEDVTENARTIRSIPFRAKAEEVRGEVVFNRKSFDKLDESRRRDFAGCLRIRGMRQQGSLRVLDLITASRRLDYFSYYLVPTPPTQHETLKELAAMGFKVNPNWRRCKDIEALVAL